MATLILSAVGTVIGGPIGGAIGALVGRQVDQAVVGQRQVKGPRLKELAVQTSSYGAALPRHYGTMRAAGTVIWSTELKEQREKHGGKGRPTVTTYSYSASFAVALASRPILGVGRIWADGTLLRGASGDLKVAGALRVYTGHGDQAVDSLMAQAEGTTRCPAYRHCAYVVFEDLALADYGNRIPSLTFEILADPGCSVATIASDIVPGASVTGLDLPLAGYSIDGESAGDVLAALGEAVPLGCSLSDGRLRIGSGEPTTDFTAPILPEPAASEDENADAARRDGWSRQREALPRTRQCGLRYYDVGRDHQLGLQRGVGRSELGELQVIELAAALDAPAAQAIATRASRRLSRPLDTIRYRTTEIDSAVSAGSFVRLPVASGLWRVDRWEWQKDGVLLDLIACRATAVATGAATDPGCANVAIDREVGPTILDAIELPWDGMGDGTVPQVFAAASSGSAGWTGAALFAEPEAGGGSLVALGPTGRQRAVVGTVQNVVPPATPMLVDRVSTIEVQLDADDLTLNDATFADLLGGANRALVGDEIIQFAGAALLGGATWRLSTLLRGRGGSEWAVAGHVPGERFVLADERLIRLDPARIGNVSASRIVALGLGDASPVRSAVRGAGATLRPLDPVHGVAKRLSDGSLTLCWRRRARGAWGWPDYVDAPLNEEAESWEVTFGEDAAAPLRWTTAVARIDLPAAQAVACAARDPAGLFRIRQVGRIARSLPLTIALPA